MTSPDSWRRHLGSAPFLLTAAFTFVLLLLRIEHFVFGDTWFNLVLGREVAHSGVLYQDRITAVGLGTRVLDVQWLAHLGMYHLARLTGITGLVTAGASLVVLSVIGGAIGALRMGATPGRVLFATCAAFMALGAQAVLRAQTLVYPLLIATVWMLWDDTRAPKRRTWLVVPLSVLWANLHGSVLLSAILGGAMLVARVLDAWRAHRAFSPALLARDALLVVTLAATVFATPYGTSVWEYYRSTAGNPVFRDYITEWFPLWSAPDAGLVGLGGVVVLALAFAWRRSESFPLLVMAGLSFMMLMSVRHATPLALACLVLLPRLLDHALGDRLPLAFNEVSPRIAGTMLVVTVVMFAVLVPLLAGEDNHRPGTNSLEARVAATPGTQCLLVDEQQGDRLLWYYPQLTGRLSHTVRVETIPVEYLRTLGRAYAAPDAPASHQLWRRFPIVALDARLHEQVIAALATDTTFEQLGHEGNLVVFRHRLGMNLPDACAAVRRGARLDTSTVIPGA